MSISENVAKIRAEMEAAAIAAGRDPKSIQLCAATKMNDAAAVREAIRAGIDCCGVNKVQELVQKLAENAYEGVPVHFIGHLQTNKVKQVVGKVDLIQSVDSERLIRAIDKEAAKQGIVQDILDDSLLLCLLVDGGKEPLGVHTLDQIHLAHHKLDLVGLQVTDEVDGHPLIGIFGQL